MGWTTEVWNTGITPNKSKIPTGKRIVKLPIYNTLDLLDTLFDQMYLETPDLLDNDEFGDLVYDIKVEVNGKELFSDDSEIELVTEVDFDNKVVSIKGIDIKE